MPTPKRRRHGTHRTIIDNALDPVLRHLQQLAALKRRLMRDDAGRCHIQCFRNINTRLTIWAGIAMRRDFDLARVAYDDLTGRPQRANGSPPDGVSWIYFAKDVWVSAQMARRRELPSKADPERSTSSQRHRLRC